MSYNITERASELRATAAASIIKNEIESKDISLVITKFKIKSPTAIEISDNERIILANIQNRINNLLIEVIASLIDVSSAVSASINPPNSAASLTTILNIVDSAKKAMVEVEETKQQIEEASDFTKLRSIILSIQDKLKKTLIEVTNALNQMHKLLFGDASP